MRPATDSLPKPLLPVLGRPFAELQLEWLAREGVTGIVYSIGYRGDMLREALGDGSRFGVRIDYVDEGEDLRGSGGALRLALDLGLLPNAFFVLYGDAYLTVDLASVEATWLALGLPALMTVLRNRGRWDASNARFQDGRVVYDKHRVLSPGQEMEWIDYGLSVLNRGLVAGWLPPGGRGDLADLMHQLSVEGKVGGYEETERFYEIGSPEGLRDFEAYLATTDY